MSAAEPPPLDPPVCLRVALRAYPPADRALYGPDLIDAATDLAAAGSTTREVAGLVRGGFGARARRVRAGLRAVDRRAAGDALVEPLTGAIVAIFGAAAIARMAGSIGEHAGARAGVTLGALLLLAELSVLVVAVARRQRMLAVAASSALLFQVVISAGWAQWRAGIVTAAPPLHLHVGDWWFGPSLVWSIAPFIVALVLACSVMTPASARLGGLRRRPRELHELRLVVLFVPSALLGLVLLVRPGLLLGPDGDTTELPAILFLMLIVGALWAVTSSPGGRDHLAAAAALVGLAAVPSVAYGFADLMLPTFDFVPAPTTRLGVVLGLSTIVVAGWITVFLSALAAVGLRTGAGAPPHGNPGAQ